ncbi:MAG: VCBS repeat-containing protein [Planctomycetota bacterium]
MNLKHPRLLLAVCLAAAPLWAQPALRGPSLANHRSRLPHSTGPAVACVLADLDGDGDQDLARATSSDVIFALQDPSGRLVTLSTPHRLPTNTGTTIHTVALGPFSKAKAADLLVVYRNGTCWLGVNNGKGMISRSFFLPPLKNVLNPLVHAVLVGDLDGSFGQDIVVILNQLAPQVYLANNSGSYAAPTVLTAPSLLNPAATLVDIDQDKDQDLVLVTGDASKAAQPSVYLNSNGKFGSPASGFFSTNLTIAARQVVAADINNSGRREIMFASAAAGSSAPRIFTRSSATSLLYQEQKNAGKFQIRSAFVLQAVEVTGDGFVDLLALGADGSLVLGVNAGTPARGTFAAARVLLQPGPRRCLAVADLEPDKDLDLVVGGALLEDSLLLGDGKGGFLNTEDRGMPSATHPPCAGALVDATGEGDPDIVLYDRTGKPTLLINQNGQARFQRDPLTALPVSLPALPRGTYTDVQAAAAATTQPVDLVVLGTAGVVAQPGLRVLVRTKSGNRHFYRDETASRFRSQGKYVVMAVGDVGGQAAGSKGAKGYSDLVVLNTSRQLQLVLNNQGAYSVHGTIVSNVEAGSRILLGHVNGLQDQLLDILLLQPTLGIRVFLGQASPVDTFKEGTAIKATPGVGLLADLTGDKATDLLIANGKALQLFQGNAKGGFTDASTKILTANVTSVSSLALIQSASDALPNVAVGVTTGADILFRRMGNKLAPEQLPYRGSHVTQGCLTGDLDLDGDDDLVTLCATTLPGVLLGQSSQLTQNSVTQVGRSLRLAVRLPSITAMGLVGVWFQPTRIPVPGLGILRIQNPIPILSFGPNATATDVLLPIPASLKPQPVPVQLFVVHRNVLKIVNLDILELTRN